MGSFIRYVGEVITTEEAERRGIEYDKGGFSTLFDLDAAGVECEYTIDATFKCGVARFLNHSCAPNLRQYCVWADTLSLALPRIAFFATRDIEPLEELTFDYSYAEGSHTLRCHCGAPNCRQWLY
jgi:histone-lysine N-methyltransferase SUV39H